MTFHSDNEPAERLPDSTRSRDLLLSRLYGLMPWPKNGREVVDAALAAERRATVERIRAALEEGMQPFGPIDDINMTEIMAVLDAEAQR